MEFGDPAVENLRNESHPKLDGAIGWPEILWQVRNSELQNSLNVFDKKNSKFSEG